MKEEIKLNKNKNIESIINKNKTENKNMVDILNNNDDNQENKNIINFSAETTLLKDKFNQEIKYLQNCMLETRIKQFNKVDKPKL